MKQKTGRPAIDESTAEWIVGSDEAGYGTWAGDLIVVGVAVRQSWKAPEVTDSKKLSDKARKAIVKKYKGTVLWHLTRKTSEEIDSAGVWAAVIAAHNEVHAKLAKALEEKHPGEEVLHIVDGLENAVGKGLRTGVVPLPKADSLIPAVALASCFAKVAQCVAMDRAHEKYPQYGFDKSRGYGTPKHQVALAKHGACPIHRRSYAPVRRTFENPKFEAVMDLLFEDDD